MRHSQPCPECRLLGVKQKKSGAKRTFLPKRQISARYQGHERRAAASFMSGSDRLLDRRRCAPGSVAAAFPVAAFVDVAASVGVAAFVATFLLHVAKGAVRAFGFRVFFFFAACPVAGGCLSFGLRVTEDAELAFRLGLFGFPSGLRVLLPFVFLDVSKNTVTVLAVKFCPCLAGCNFPCCFLALQAVGFLGGPALPVLLGYERYSVRSISSRSKISITSSARMSS